MYENAAVVITFTIDVQRFTFSMIFTLSDHNSNFRRLERKSIIFPTPCNFIKGRKHKKWNFKNKKFWTFSLAQK